MSLRETLKANLSLAYEDVPITVKGNPVMVRVVALNGPRLSEYRAEQKKWEEAEKAAGRNPEDEDDGYMQLIPNLFDPETGDQLFRFEDLPWLRANLCVQEGMMLIRKINEINKTGVDLGKASEPTTNAAHG